MKLYCTIDFFFDRWDDPDRRQLWMGVFPYVRNAAELAVWVETVASNGRKADYELLSWDSFANDDSDEEQRRAMVPVPLSDDTDYRVVIPGFGEISPKRLERFLVSDPARFRSLNEEPRLTPVSEIAEAGAALANPSANQAYAKSLIEGIRAAAQEEKDPSNPAALAQWLQFAFEIGQARRFDELCMDAPGAYISVEHRDDPRAHDTESATHHCLAGLMVPLGGDIALLKTVKDVRIELLVGGVVHQTLNLTASTNGATALQRMFSTISTSLSELAPRLRWVDGFDSRVYALPTPRLFRRENLGSAPTVFRLPRVAPGESAHAGDIAHGSLTRITARYAQQVNEDTDAATTSHPKGPIDLALRAARSFDVQLTPYRNYPIPDAGASLRSNGYLMQLVAQPHEVSRWERLLTETYEERNSLPGLNVFVMQGDSYALVTVAWAQLFCLPWQAKPKPELLLYCDEPLLGQAIALVDPTPANDFKLALRGLDETSDPYGIRWEYVSATAATAPEFDALIFDDANTELDPNTLVIAAFTQNAYQFELAQSARRIEGVAKVEMDLAPHTPPNESTARDEYLGDLINYNAANYAALWSGERTLLTAYTESTADFAARTAGGVQYSFQFRFTHPTSARSEMDDVRLFYRDLYGKLGTDRAIFLDVEHTYGSSIYLEPSLPMRTCIDEPLRNPAQVGAADKDSRNDLLRVDYLAEEENNTLRLTLGRRILSESWIDTQPDSDQAKLKEAHVEAWQAIAEAAYADSLELHLQAYAFSFTAALAQNGKSIGDGLVEAVPPVVIDITEELGAAARRWLDTALSSAPDDWTLEFNLPGAPLWKVSNVLRCYLRVKRSEAFSVPATRNWNVVSNPVAPPAGGMQNIVSEDGYHVDVVPNDVSNMLGAWINSVRENASYVLPNTTDGDVRDRYRGLIGSGPASTSARPNADHWIIPQGTKEHEADSSVSITPIGFRPVRRVAHLGDATGQMLRRYFALLDYVLSMASDNIADALSADEWKSLFSSFDLRLSEGGKGWALYNQLCDNTAELLHPVPATQKAQNGEDTLAPEVVEVANALKRDAGIGAAVKARFRGSLAESPAIYANNKALCLYRVYGRSGDRPAADGFYSLHVKKRIQSEEETGLDETRDHFNATFYQGVRDPQDAAWYGLLEYLDDDVYDNEFQVLQLGLRSAEDVLEDRGENVFSVPIQNNSIFVPAAAPQELGADQEAPFIFLPSRRLVRKPSIVSTDVYELAQDPAAFNAAFPINVPRDFNAFIEGRAASPAGSIVPVKRVAASPEMQRSGTIDDKVVSYIFAVVGDEEFELDWINGVANDAFILRIDEGQNTQTTDESSAPSEVVSGVFELLQNPDTARDRIESIGVLHGKVLSYVSDALSKPSPVVNEAKEFFARFTIERDGDQQPAVQVKLGRKAKLRQKALQIHLFRPEGPNNDDVLYIWINVELPVWRSSAATLQQTRNISDAKRRFEDVFGMLSTVQSDGIQSRRSLIASAEPWGMISIQRRDASPQAFLQTLLIDHPAHPIVRELGDHNGRLRFDISITISEVIAPSFPVQSPGQPVITRELPVGKYPLSNIRVQADTGNDVSNKPMWQQPVSADVYFPSPSKRFVVDVEWRHTDTNDLLLRVEDVRAVVS